MAPKVPSPEFDAGLAALLALALCTTVAQGLARFSFGPLLPLMRGDVVNSYAAGGMLATTHMIGYLAGAFLSLRVSKRIAASRVVQWGLGSTTIGLGCLTVSSGPAVAGVGLFFTGVGGALVWLPAPGLAAAVFRRDPGRGIGIVASSMGLGIALGSGIPVLSDVLGGWRGVWGVEAVIAIVVLVAAHRLLKTSEEPQRSSDKKDALWRPDARWWCTTIAFSSFSFGTVTCLTFFVAALMDAGVSTRAANGVYGLIGIAMICGGVVAERLSRLAGRVPTLIGQCVGAAGAVLFTTSGYLPFAVIMALILGMSMSGTAAVVSADLNDRYPQAQMTAAFSLMFIPVGIGQILGPLTGGWAGDLTGDPFTALVVAGSVMAAGSVPLLIQVLWSARRSKCGITP
ncbi:MFS transporter [Rhodococcus ruber]|uniref:MFS transporter n=1 Tax=Rhodococcus ruber TaxID=1830 RepID=UPI000E6B043A|nr:MFS transporter [Rhodococcus ruber]AXY49288.1 major Facilitator Superfamily protein [Rhodococcus ruber]